MVVTEGAAEVRREALVAEARTGQPEVAGGETGLEIGGVAELRSRVLDLLEVFERVRRDEPVLTAGRFP